VKAAICKRYGTPEVLRIEEVPKPVPKNHQVLIGIDATAVNSSDWYVRSAAPHARLLLRVLMRLFIGLRAPRNPILGLVVAGNVEAAGRSARKFRPGEVGTAAVQLAKHFGANLVDAGKLRPVIDRTYALDQIAEAHRYVQQDHKSGNVVITVRHPPD